MDLRAPSLVGAAAAVTCRAWQRHHRAAKKGKGKTGTDEWVLVARERERAGVWRDMEQAEQHTELGHIGGLPVCGVRAKERRGAGHRVGRRGAGHEREGGKGGEALARPPAGQELEGEKKKKTGLILELG